MWSSEPCEGLAVCRAKTIPSFLRYFKTLSIGPASGIEPLTSRIAVKRSTDLASALLWTCNILSIVSFGIVSSHSLAIYFVLELLSLIDQEKVNTALGTQLKRFT